MIWNTRYLLNGVTETGQTTPAHMRYTSVENGNLYICGNTKSSNLNSESYLMIFLHKVEVSAGTTQWMRTWGLSPSGSDDICTGMTVFPDGSRIIINGQSESFKHSSITGQAATQIIFDNLGYMISAKSYSGYYTQFLAYGNQVVIDKFGEFIYEAHGGLLLNGKQAIIYQKVQFQNMQIQYMKSFQNVATLTVNNKILLTTDNSYLLISFSNTGSGTFSSGSSNNIIIAGIDPGTGGLIYMKAYEVATTNLIQKNSCLSPENTFHYIAYQIIGTPSTVAILTLHVKDGTIYDYATFQAQDIMGIFINPLLLKLQVAATIKSPVTLRIGLQSNAILINWDTDMQDQTCAGFGFQSTQPTWIILDSNTYNPVDITSTTILKFPINQDPTTINNYNKASSPVSQIYNSFSYLRTAVTCSTTNQVIDPGSILSTNSYLYQAALFCQPPSPAVITYTGTFFDGTALSSLITFTSSPPKFDIQSSSQQYGTFYIKITGVINGNFNEVASLARRIQIQNTAPQAFQLIGSVTYKVGISDTFSFEFDRFFDQESDYLTYAAYKDDLTPLPNWIYFSSSYRTFYFKAPSVQTLNVRLFAYDNQGQSTFQDFQMIFANYNPIILNSVKDMTINTYEYTSYQIPKNAYSDADGHNLTITATIQLSLAPLPTFILLQNRLFSFFPTKYDAGTYNIALTINDGYGGLLINNFKLIVNTKPKQSDIKGYIPDMNITQGVKIIDLSQYFEDPDAGDLLTYQIKLANGLPILNNWLIINGNILSITAPLNNVGNNYVQVTAIDLSLASFTQTFNLLVNSPPVIGTLMPSYIATQGIAFSYTIPSNAFTDPDNHQLTYSAFISPFSALPGWLKFEPNQGLFYGTPSSTDINVNTLNIYANDPFLQISASQTITLTVQANNPPQIRSGKQMQNQTIKSNQEFSFQIPDELFQDFDGESLVLNLLLPNNSVIPSWIQFTPENRLVYGKAVTNLQYLDIKIVALDPKKSQTSTQFRINVEKNKVPLVIEEIPIIDTYMDMFFEFQIPENTFRDEDGDYLLYSIEHFDEKDVMPTWLRFINTNRTILGFPKEYEVKQFMFKIFVDDGRDGKVYQVLYLNVNENFAPEKIVPLIIVVILPLIGIFGFVFAMAFVRVPPIQNSDITSGNKKVTFDELKQALYEQLEYKRKQALN